MEVRAGTPTGRLLYSGTLERGRHKRFQGRQLHITLAAPQNVSVRLNGRRRELPNGSTFVVTAHHISQTAS